jgi:hypothetical protein
MAGSQEPAQDEEAVLNHGKPMLINHGAISAFRLIGWILKTA